MHATSYLYYFVKILLRGSNKINIHIYSKKFLTNWKPEYFARRLTGKNLTCVTLIKYARRQRCVGEKYFGKKKLATTYK